MNPVIRFMLAGLFVCAVSACAVSGEPNRASHVKVSLCDGSLIVGSPFWKEIVLRTAYGDLNIPVESITRIDVKTEGKSAALSATLTNKDTISGHIKFDDVRICTSFGNQTLPLAQIRKIEFSRTEDIAGFANTTWRYSRGDGSLIAQRLVLKEDGFIGEYNHPNETSWAVEDGKLIFLHLNGLPTTTYDKFEIRNHQRILGGWMTDGHEYHVLEELKRESKGPSDGLLSPDEVRKFQSQRGF